MELVEGFGTILDFDCSNTGPVFPPSVGRSLDEVNVKTVTLNVSDHREEGKSAVVTVNLAPWQAKQLAEDLLVAAEGTKEEFREVEEKALERFPFVCGFARGSFEQRETAW